MKKATTVAALGLLGILLTPLTPRAQAPTPAAAPASQEDADALRFHVTVTAPKVPEDVQDVPASVTAVTSQTLESAGVRYISDAAVLAPNAFITDWSARKLSNPTFRGIGSSPSNPAVTTYIDGVPQLNTNSASLELVDVDQIEFVRGPQSALYGRNTLGGLINITSKRPSLTRWTGGVTGLPGDFHLGDVRGDVSGPVVRDRLALSLGFGYSGRDGFTANDATGRDVDSRSALFGKGQLLWTPNADWQARVVVSGERARDGDFALTDLAALRARPFHTSRDVEGFTDRDVVAPTVLVARAGGDVDFSSLTGVVRWKTVDHTDLDYSPLPLITRDNSERDLQFTQEFRFASGKHASIRLGEAVLKWQAGVFVFTQRYTQDAVNNFAPFLLSPFLGFPVSQHSPQSALDDRGVGVYGQGTLTLWGKLDGIVGVRGDSEHKQAALNVFYTPAIAPAAAVNTEKNFSDMSPQFTLAYRMVPGKNVYVTAARGFKAGGFNAASPAGSEAYGEEHNWSYEAGVKTAWLAQRVVIDASAFSIDWRDMQVNVPNPAVPAQFYIASVGGARSKGVELEVSARALPSLDLFGSVGYTDALFVSGARSSGGNVGGNKLPNTPDYTASFAVQPSVGIPGSMTLCGRAEFVLTGAFQYNDANTAGQSAYSLVNLRVGAHGKRAFVEGWVRNAFDTRYVPVALAYGALAPSGFLGESGAPRTFGARIGWTF